MVIGLLVVLLVIWIGCAVLGFVIKGLLWLAVVGIILFLVTAGWAWLKGSTGGKNSVSR